MKKYITPTLQTVTLRVEESIASVRLCNGACSKDINYGNFHFYAHGS